MRVRLEQGGEHRGDGSQGTRSEIRGLNGRQAGCGVLQHAGPAEVVEVMPDPRRVAAVGAEAGDRAVHDRLRHVVRADAEPRRDTRAKALEHHVRAGAELTPEGGLGLQVDDHRLLAGVQCGLPRRRDVAHRIALGRLDPDDAGAELEQLPGGEGPRQVAGQIDDEHPGERLHWDATLPAESERATLWIARAPASSETLRL